MSTLSILLSGCNTENSEKTVEKPQNTSAAVTENTNTKADKTNTEYSKVLKVDSVQDKATIRAEVNTDAGKLYVESNGKEKIGHITTPSVLGSEGDFSYQGNYSVKYNYDNETKVIKELNDITFIQPSEKPISFEKISFEEIDVFLLTPQYTASRGYDSYAFGIDKKSKEAFPLTFKDHDSILNTINYEKGEVPFNENEKLVVKTRNTEGKMAENDTLITKYHLDQKNKQFIAGE